MRKDTVNIKQINNKYIKGYQDEHNRPTLYPRSENKKGNYDSENPSYLFGLYVSLVRRINADDAHELSEYYSKFLLNNQSVIKNGYVFFSRQPFGLNTYPTDHLEYNPERNWNTNSKDEYVGIVSAGNITIKLHVYRTGVRNDWVYDDYPNSEELDKRYKHPLSNQFYYCIEANEDPTWLQFFSMILDSTFDTVMRLLFARGNRQKDKGKLIEKIRRPVADSIIKDFMKWGEVKYLNWAIDYYFEDENHPFKKMVKELNKG